MSSPVPWQDATGIFAASGLIAPHLVEYPNLQFSKPEPPEIWVSLADVGDSLGPIEMGPNATWQETGSIYFTVMTPAGQGTDLARALAKSITTLYRNLGPRPVVYTRSSVGSGQVSGEDGAWWAIVVAVDWRYQDILTG